MDTILILSIVILFVSVSYRIMAVENNLISRIGFSIGGSLFAIWIALQTLTGVNVPNLESLSANKFTSIYSDPNLSACIWIADKDKEDRKPLFYFITRLFVEDKKKKSYSPETYNYMNEICQNSVEPLVSGNGDTKELSWFERNTLGKYVWTDEWQRRYKKINANWKDQIDKQLENSKNKW